MMNRKIPRKDGQKRKKKSKKSSSSQPDFFQHHLYGKVPVVLINGVRVCDPDFRPRLPAGAVRGDVQKQDFCSWCHFPKYYYIDEGKDCIDCDKDFVFSAKEQKFWYEDRQFNFYSKPIRCLDCRRQNRFERSLRDKMTAATNALNEKPEEPAILLAYAETVYDYHTHFGQGKLEQALAAARKAYRLSSSTHLALYWEAACLDAADHLGKAKLVYEQFLTIAKKSSRTKTYIEQASERVEELIEFSNNFDSGDDGPSDTE